MKIQIWNLKKCGFYDSLEDEEEAKFGLLPEWWGEFHSWVQNRHPKQTGTFTSSSEPYTVYCIRRGEDAAGNYGVALWNVSPSVNGRAMHLSADGVVDYVQAKIAETDEGDVAGWPTYFWLMPGESAIASLIPDALRGSGIAHARKYFRNYLKFRSSYWRDGGFNQRGFDDPLPLVPRFETEPFRKPGTITEIANEWENISKFVTESTYEPPNANQDGSLLRRVRSWLPPQVENSHMEEKTRKPRSVKIEVPWRPASREAVVDAIRSWNDRVFDDNNWAGVVTNKGLRRFDEMLCRDHVELSAELDADPRWDKETMEHIWEQVKPKARSLINQARSNTDAQE